MTVFKHKVVRCEWQVVDQWVDQYGMSTKDRKVLSSWGTYEEAFADLPKFGAPSVWVKDRWIPFNSISGYQILEIQYKEVVESEYDK